MKILVDNESNDIVSIGDDDTIDQLASEIENSTLYENIVFPEGFDPDDPETFAIYTYVDNAFVVNQDELSGKVRRTRNSLLKEEVDVIVSNPLRWNSMTTEEQQEWTDYRQALLDVPQQSGFPDGVTWPVKP